MCALAEEIDQQLECLKFSSRKAPPFWGKTLGAQHETHIYDMNIYSGGNVKAKLAQTLAAGRNTRINMQKAPVGELRFVIISLRPRV